MFFVVIHAKEVFMCWVFCKLQWVAFLLGLTYKGEPSHKWLAL